MAGDAVAERLRWAVDRLAVRPSDRLLEIGCWGGVAVALIGPLLDDGRLVAIDRSATAIGRAERRNADLVAEGKVELRTAALEASAFGAEVFDKIFAVNVNVFWTSPATAELGLIRRVLARGGELLLFYEPPSAAQLEMLLDRTGAALSAAGFTMAPEVEGRLLCLRAEPVQPAR